MLPDSRRSCSPRTWRWSVGFGRMMCPGGVLSTHVEVVRGRPNGRRKCRSALHARGGGPIALDLQRREPLCSPRTWRWSGGVLRGPRAAGVLSTHVEVVRGSAASSRKGAGALHARGGGPPSNATPRLRRKCSPRTWRWSGTTRRGFAGSRVLSTHVEVVRSSGRRT